MQKKYHINGSGNPGVCYAGSSGGDNGPRFRNCPFGGESDHYPSVLEAREAYESQQEPFAAGGASPEEPTTWSPRLLSADHLRLDPTLKLLDPMLKRADEIGRNPKAFANYQLADFADAIYYGFKDLQKDTRDPVLIEAFQKIGDEMRGMVFPHRPSTDELIRSHAEVRRILREIR